MEAPKFNASSIAGIIVIVVSVIGFWGGLAVLFNLPNPLSSVTTPLFNLTKLFLSDFASLIFWFIIFFLGIALMTPSKGGYSDFLDRRKK